MLLCKVELIFSGRFMVPIGGIYIPRSQPLYPDMELADTISVSENKYNQYKHTTAFILNIWLNKSLWPLHWRQPSCQPWNVLVAMIFLFCLLVPFQYSIDIYCSMANTSPEVTSAARMQSWLSKDRFLCHGNLFMNM